MILRGYPRANYHVMNRGDRRETIFLNDPDRALFLDTFGQKVINHECTG